MKKILYIGWIGFGNLGDELLWHIFKDLSNYYLNQEEIKIIPSLPDLDIQNIEPYDAIVLGGGSLLLPGYIEILYKAIERQKEIFIWGSGIDWIDKEELDLILLGKAPCLEKLSPEREAAILRETFAKAKFAGVRGPLTKQVLASLGANSKNIQIIGDPGLLLETQDIPNIKNQEKIVGINWGTTYDRLYGQNEIEVEDALVNVSKNLIKQGYKILIYTVWAADSPSCQRLFEKINSPENVKFDDTLYNEQELMSQLSSCSMTINFKLHANLLSLATHVPCIPLGYRFKVFDLAYLLGLEKYIVSTDAPLLDINILERVKLIEDNHSEILKQFRLTQKYYNHKLLEPFQNQFKWQD